MAQVSESTSGIQEAVRSLQPQSPRQNEQTTRDSAETSQNARTDRQDQRTESNQASQARQTEDRVVISQEALTENRETRTDEGKRNVDNLRPPSEQRANERGSRQRLTDLNETTPSGTPNLESESDPVPSAGASQNSAQEVNTQRNRTASREQAQVRDPIQNETRDNRNAEVQLREFQNQNTNEVRIEPRQVSESVDEISGQRERAADAREVVFETPSQRIIEEVEPSETGQAESPDNNARSEQTANTRQSASPVSAQTETGQNVDDLI